MNQEKIEAFASLPESLQSYVVQLEEYLLAHQSKAVDQEKTSDN